MRLLPSGKHDPDMLRLLALTLERSEWDTALAMWDGYLTATATGLLSTTGPGARVLLHMANLFPADPEAVLDTLEVESEQQLRRRIRTGQLPACFDRAALLERARVADPVPQVYRALVAHYDQWGDPKRAEAEAEAWRRAHPQDLEPLLYLIRAAERRGAIRKALALLADAEALDRVHPEVRQSRFRLSWLALSVVSKKASQPSPSTISSGWRTNPVPVKAITQPICWHCAGSLRSSVGTLLRQRNWNRP